MGILLIFKNSGRLEDIYSGLLIGYGICMFMYDCGTLKIKEDCILNKILKFFEVDK